MSTNLRSLPSAPGQSPAPAPPTKPSLWDRFKRFVIGLFAVIGAVSAVITVNQYLFPDTGEQRIIEGVADHSLAYRSNTFPMGVTVDGVDAGNEDILQTEVTFWRDGGTPIKADMTRGPLHVFLPSGSHLVTYRVLAMESSVPDNFTVERTGDALAIRWKVWDPDMALKIAIVRSGSPASVLISSEVGPGVVVNGTRYGALKLLGLALVLLVTTLFLFGGFFGSIIMFLRFSPKWEGRIRSISVRRMVTLSVIIGLVALFMVGSNYETQVVSWLASRMVKQIPFQ